MRVILRFSGGERSDFGDHDYEGVLADSLDRFRHRIQQVSLYIEDVNGPRGGIDKACRCVLQLRKMAPVVIQDKDEHMSALIHRVASRATYVLSQKADRLVRRGKQNRRPDPLPERSVEIPETTASEMLEASLMREDWDEIAKSLAT